MTLLLIGEVVPYLRGVVMLVEDAEKQYGTNVSFLLSIHLLFIGHIVLMISCRHTCNYNHHGHWLFCITVTRILCGYAQLYFIVSAVFGCPRSVLCACVPRNWHSQFFLANFSLRLPCYATSDWNSTGLSDKKG